MLPSFLDDWRLTQAQVAKATGIAEPTIPKSPPASGKLNRKQNGKLAKYYRVSPEVFTFAV